MKYGSDTNSADQRDNWRYEVRAYRGNAMIRV